MFVSRAGWPLLAMESQLTKRIGPGYWRAADGPYDNDGTVDAGLQAALHWSHPHADGSDGWCSRRLPLRPLVAGFLVNTLCAAGITAGLISLWRLQLIGRVAGRWWRLCGVLALGALLNLSIALGLWSRWQYAQPARQLNHDWFRPGASSESNATTLHGDRARWPISVPSDWPTAPRWIGWCGSSLGVRGYEFTSRGVPSAALMWLHVTWGPGALDPHQKINVVQVGWPLTCLQSEDLVEVEGRGAESIGSNGFPDRRGWPLPKTTPLVRRGAICNITLPGSPPSTSESDPMPFIPARPR